jgi:hypothetical protein
MFELEITMQCFGMKPFNHFQLLVLAAFITRIADNRRRHPGRANRIYRRYKNVIDEGEARFSVVRALEAEQREYCLENDIPVEKRRLAARKGHSYGVIQEDISI